MNGQNGSDRIVGLNYMVPPDYLYMGFLAEIEEVAESSFPLRFPEWKDLLNFSQRAQDELFLMFFGDLLVAEFEDYLITSYSTEWLQRIVEEELFMEMVEERKLLKEEDPMPLFDLLVRYADYLKMGYEKQLLPIWLLYEKNPSLPYF